MVLLCAFHLRVIRLSSAFTLRLNLKHDEFSRLFIDHKPVSCTGKRECFSVMLDDLLLKHEVLKRRILLFRDSHNEAWILPAYLLHMAFGKKYFTLYKIARHRTHSRPSPLLRSRVLYVLLMLLQLMVKRSRTR